MKPLRHELCGDPRSALDALHAVRWYSRVTDEALRSHLILHAPGQNTHRHVSDDVRNILVNQCALASDLKPMASGALDSGKQKSGKANKDQGHTDNGSRKWRRKSRSVSRVKSKQEANRDTVCVHCRSSGHHEAEWCKNGKEGRTRARPSVETHLRWQLSQRMDVWKNRYRSDQWAISRPLESKKETLRDQAMGNRLGTREHQMDDLKRQSIDPPLVNTFSLEQLKMAGKLWAAQWVVWTARPISTAGPAKYDFHIQE